MRIGGNSQAGNGRNVGLLCIYVGVGGFGGKNRW